MKKRKVLINHEEIARWNFGDDDVNVVCSVILNKHTDMRSGYSMFSLNLNDVPVVTCDCCDFLEQVMDIDPNLLYRILIKVGLKRGCVLTSEGIKSNLESEE